MNADFVVIGARGGPTPGGVMLWASDKLTYMELEERMNDYASDVYQWSGQIVRSGWPPRREIQLVAAMRDYVMVTAATYAEAWVKLFDTLNPPTCPGGDGPWTDEASRSVIQAHYLFNHREPAPRPPDPFIRFKPNPLVP